MGVFEELSALELSKTTKKVQEFRPEQVRSRLKTLNLKIFYLGGGDPVDKEKHCGPLQMHSLLFLLSECGKSHSFHVVPPAELASHLQ